MMIINFFYYWFSLKYAILNLVMKINLIDMINFIIFSIKNKEINNKIKHNIFNNCGNNWRLILNKKKGDVPIAWGLYFQDGASPSFEGIVDLHNRIMFYLIVILFGVSWIFLSIMWNFNKSQNKLVYRYLNHGKYVPIQKYSKFDNTILKNKMYILLRSYTTLSGNSLNNNDINQVKVYGSVYDMKKDILKENISKSGIYMLINKLTNDIYILDSP